ncbi:MAG TPA: Uma2 family endonuclease [Planctomycetales bacterium]|jgi:Uma2 family endonuclease|nr:Uma2 family endonuclease [Planctomycetales bacterium]
MAGIPTKAAEGLDYPTSDGKPMAETDWHRDLMNALIQTLVAYYAAEPMVYVSGNLLVFYKPGNRRRHLSPDVFVVKGVGKHQRPNYLIWEEGKGPEVVIELTSQSTREEDVEDKYELYQDTLRVPEYFLFDPLGDYLQPALQGHRLRRGRYEPIIPVKGRLPSKVLGLHLEGHDRELRLYDPTTKQWLLTPQEAVANAQETVANATEAQRQAEAEVERLRRELAELRHQRNGK